MNLSNAKALTDAAADSLLPLWQQAAPYLSSRLINARQAERLQQAVVRLPDSFVVGLECRLGEDTSPVDLWICPGIEPVSLQRAGRWLAAQSWPQLRPLSQELMAQRIPWPLAWGAWTLEFDLVSNRPLPTPSSFVTFASRDNALDIVSTVIKLWQGSQGASPSKQVLARLHALMALCPSGTLAGLGFLYPRAGSPARIMLDLPTPESLKPYLGAGYEQVAPILTGISRKIVLGTAFDYEHEKRHSIELYPDSPAALEELLQRLINADLCTPSKAQGVLEMAGNSLSGSLGSLFCTLNHIKLSISSQLQMEAKAYPSLGRIPS